MLYLNFTLNALSLTVQYIYWPLYTHMSTIYALFLRFWDFRSQTRWLEHQNNRYCYRLCRDYSCLHIGYEVYIHDVTCMDVSLPHEAFTCVDIPLSTTYFSSYSSVYDEFEHSPWDIICTDSCCHRWARCLVRLINGQRYMVDFIRLSVYLYIIHLKIFLYDGCLQS